MRLFKRRGAAAPSDESIEAAPQPTLPPPPATDARGKRAVGEQRDYLLSLIAPLPAFGMYLLDAWGAAVCEDIVADQQMPTADLVAVDGCAVRAEDLEGLEPGTRATLRVRDDAKVSKVGSAVRVRAGQVLPEGADAVIPAGRTSLDGNVLTIRNPVKSGDHVRLAGSEVQVDVPLMRSGERLDARKSALLALAGIDRVLARPRPRVVVLNTPDPSSEASEVESQLLAAAAKSDGAQVWRVELGIGSDRELHDAISDQLIRADLVIVSSTLDASAQLPRVVAAMGLHDVADVALDHCGRIGFALVGEDQVPMAILPSDPVAAYVGYQFFVRPLIRRLMGAPTDGRVQTTCVAGGELTGEPGLMQVVFGVIHTERGAEVLLPLGRPDAPRLIDLVSANAMAVLDEKTTSVRLGERIDCWLLDD